MWAWYKKKVRVMHTPFSAPSSSPYPVFSKMSYTAVRSIRAHAMPRGESKIGTNTGIFVRPISTWDATYRIERRPKQIQLGSYVNIFDFSTSLEYPLDPFLISK